MLVAAVSLILTGCALQRPAVLVPSPLPIKHVAVGNAPLTVEIAATDAAREHGLSGRAGLPEGHGMLFTFSTSGRYEFWMYDMRFGLDFLWITGGKVAEVTPNVPPPTRAAPDPVRLRPNEAVEAVIEVPAGWAAAHQVIPGAEVKGLP